MKEESYLSKPDGITKKQWQEIIKDSEKVIKGCTTNEEKVLALYINTLRYYRRDKTLATTGWADPYYAHAYNVFKTKIGTYRGMINEFLYRLKSIGIPSYIISYKTDKNDFNTEHIFLLVKLSSKKYVLIDFKDESLCSAFFEKNPDELILDYSNFVGYDISVNCMSIDKMFQPNLILN